MWSRPPPEVSCMSSSVESFYRGAVAGGIFGMVFPPEGSGLLLRLGAPFRPALLAGSWCFLNSLASCESTRQGLIFPWNGALSGLFSGYVIAVLSRWPRESVALTMVTSCGLSLLSHYAGESQLRDGATAAAGASCCRTNCDVSGPFVDREALPASLPLSNDAPAAAEAHCH
mmetsp:Transcript_112820/g.224439  ORF Transcript_112820/g.224439 Transcript_112820/m.224439 type:complete len:172 (+) Transcript_112820:107-622(+)|eukprot:CAMPEP_0172713002 /NCGR_PEP_ID=MMETSP1074-20121228/61431_1 /TAXON_ID=2916 /ORGANISM="Ceratium fusus, Strain PA161109" /LENGTH=171 /DNA_ID=CAMNT_0013537017 /DNA_START=113 /DNA_END=628 /DNA_ORIENTATION=-